MTDAPRRGPAGAGEDGREVPVGAVEGVRRRRPAPGSTSPAVKPRPRAPRRSAVRLPGAPGPSPPALGEVAEVLVLLDRRGLGPRQPVPCVASCRAGARPPADRPGGRAYVGRWRSSRALGRARGRLRSATPRPVVPGPGRRSPGQDQGRPAPGTRRVTACRRCPGRSGRGPTPGPAARSTRGRSRARPRGRRRTGR